MFRKLFGKASAPEMALEHYKEFAIYPAAVKDGSDFRLAARVEKQIGDELKVHHLIRADTFPSADAANAAGAVKAKQLIDQMGDRLFN
jgi:hypothetical protein